MSNQAQDIWVVFNGEIYNYLELRKDLEAKGYCFNSRSDTEVLIHLYSDLGIEMLNKLNGMFTIALYDRKKNCIILARDRLGKKPLYYWLHRKRLAFGSEIRALRGLPGFPSELDLQALGMYFRLGWIPNWACIYPGVHKLPPATWLRYDIIQGKLDGPHSYWALPPVQIESGLTEEKWLDRIEELLWDATRIRLRSDVPIGVFLSGGIDSALVATAAARQTNGNLTSLTISFPEWGEDEWPLAQQTAKHLQIDAIHKDLKANSIPILPAVMGHFDEPFSDSSALPTALVCQTAREICTVVLSGDGGDEVFAGYENHVRAWNWRYLDFMPLGIRKVLANSICPLTFPDSRLRRFFRRLGYPIGTWGIGGKLYPYEDWLDFCLRPEFRLCTKKMDELLRMNVPDCSSAHPIDQAQRTDIRLYMLDDILVKVDRMSMRYSLEVRSPFLDYRLVELALSIPPNLRVRKGVNKYLLRRLASRYLPIQIATASKRGFGIPLYEWLFKSNYTESFRSLICSPPTTALNPFLPKGGMSLWTMAEKNVALVPSLFRVLTFWWWYKSNVEQH